MRAWACKTVNESAHPMRLHMHACAPQRSGHFLPVKLLCDCFGCTGFVELVSSALLCAHRHPLSVCVTSLQSCSDTPSRAATGAAVCVCDGELTPRVVTRPRWYSLALIVGQNCSRNAGLRIISGTHEWIGLQAAVSHQDRGSESGTKWSLRKPIIKKRNLMFLSVTATLATSYTVSVKQHNFANQTCVIHLNLPIMQDCHFSVHGIFHCASSGVNKKPL